MNYYPELPQVPYAHTTVPMISVISYLKLLNCSQDVKRMAYIMFRNESGNGDHGINNNFCGIQADSGRWPAKFGRLRSKKTATPRGRFNRIFLRIQLGLC